MEKVFWKYAASLYENPCRSAISIKLQSNFIEITIRHGCSLVNFMRIFRTPFPRNTSGRLLLKFCTFSSWYPKDFKDLFIILYNSSENLSRKHKEAGKKIIELKYFVKNKLNYFLFLWRALKSYACLC